MIKRLSKHGNSQAIVLEKPILDLLQIDEHTALRVTTDGTQLIITPIDDRDEGRQKKFQKGLAEGRRKLGPALEKLSTR